MKVRSVPISALVLDDKNPNKHTSRGRDLLLKSLKNYGMGRSVLVDKHNRVIAGNATIEAAKAAGKKRIAVIETDGDTLVAVQRGDLDLMKDKKARALSVADNRVAELDLDWDAEILENANLDLGQFWDEHELEKLLAVAPQAFEELGDDIVVEHTCPKCGYKFSGGEKGIRKKNAGKR